MTWLLQTSMNINKWSK